MRFAQLNYIYLFWIFIGLILFFIWASRSRKKAMSSFADKELLKHLADSFNPQKRSLKVFLLVACIFFLGLSLMRPQWGFDWQDVKRRGLDILIAVDTSKSMLTEDVKPNRLARAKLALSDFVKKLKGDRIGLIAFAGTAFLECPLTVDYNGFLLSLESVDTELIPKGGTSISSAIREALRSYEGGLNKYKILIIITDGEDHEGDPLKAAGGAKKEGIRIFSVGIGTQEGDLIPVQEKENGYLKDQEGNVVKSRLNEDLLERIALETGGSYVRSTSKEFGLNLIYEDKLSKMEKKEFESKMVKQYKEKFQRALAIAIILLTAEMLITEKK